MTFRWFNVEKKIQFFAQNRWAFQYSVFLHKWKNLIKFIPVLKCFFTASLSKPTFCKVNVRREIWNLFRIFFTCRSLVFRAIISRLYVPTFSIQTFPFRVYWVYRIKFVKILDEFRQSKFYLNRSCFRFGGNGKKLSI